MDTIQTMLCNQNAIAKCRGFIVDPKMEALANGSLIEYYNSVIADLKKVRESTSETSSLEDIVRDTDRFLAFARINLRTIYSHGNDPSRKLCFYYLANANQTLKQIGKETMCTAQSFIENGGVTVQMKKSGDKKCEIQVTAPSAGTITEAILVANMPLSYGASTVLQTSNNKIKYQIFRDDELKYNPEEHIYTPRHERLSQEEVDELLARLKVSKSKMNVIKIDDPICKRYGWDIGDIIRCYRDDSYLPILTPHSIGYRVVSG